MLSENPELTTQTASQPQLTEGLSKLFAIGSRLLMRHSEKQDAYDELYYDIGRKSINLFFRFRDNKVKGKALLTLCSTMKACMGAKCI